MPNKLPREISSKQTKPKTSSCAI